MRLPTQKKIMFEDLGGDAPDWARRIVDPLNSFMETVYQAMNRNITFDQNIASFIKEVVYTTPSTYPVMEEIKFQNLLKTKAVGVIILQVTDRSDYTPPAGPWVAPWAEDNGIIKVQSIPGLQASKTYNVRFLVI